MKALSKPGDPRLTRRLNRELIACFAGAIVVGYVLVYLIAVIAKAIVE